MHCSFTVLRHIHYLTSPACLWDIWEYCQPLCIAKSLIGRKRNFPNTTQLNAIQLTLAELMRFYEVHLLHMWLKISIPQRKTQIHREMFSFIDSLQLMKSLRKFSKASWESLTAVFIFCLDWLFGRLTNYHETERLSWEGTRFLPKGQSLLPNPPSPQETQFQPCSL